MAEKHIKQEIMSLSGSSEESFKKLLFNFRLPQDFEKLNNLNYEIWSTKLESHLRRGKLWVLISNGRNLVTTDPTLVYAQEVIKDMIIQSIGDKFIKNVKRYDNPAIIWQKLKEELGSSQMPIIAGLIKIFWREKIFKEGDNMKEYLKYYEENNDRLISVGEELPEKYLSLIIFGNVAAPSWSSLITQLLYNSKMDASNLKLSDTVSVLLAEYQRRKESSIAAPDEKASKPKPVKRKRSEEICSHCTKKGHAKEKWWILNPDNKPKAFSDKAKKSQ